jgi:dihydrofolate reductase
VKALRAEAGRDIWLFGGGQLFSSLVAERLVDDVEVALMPVLLGGGVPLLPKAPRVRLQLVQAATSPGGIVNLHYQIDYQAGQPRHEESGGGLDLPALPNPWADESARSSQP